MRVRSLVLFAIPLLLSSGTALAAFTSINTYGNDDGSERCLVGNASDLCTKGGDYKNHFSITRIYATDSGRTLTRLDDNTDKVWNAPLNYIEVRPIAHYLSGNGTSSAGVLTSTASFLTFADVARQSRCREHHRLDPRQRCARQLHQHQSSGRCVRVSVQVARQYLHVEQFHRQRLRQRQFGAPSDHMVSWYTGTAHRFARKSGPTCI